MLLKANALLCNNVFPPFIAFSPLGTKELDAFKSFYVACKMDFSICLDSQGF